MQPRISIIVATDRNGLIGKGNQLPWRLPADLKRFKQVTMGKSIVMGRKTHQSIGRPLPGRSNIVVTRDPEYRAEGCTVVTSLNEALSAAGEVEEVMIIGGATLYEQALPQTDRIYLTQVHAELEGDTWFPELHKADWTVVEVSDHKNDDKNPFAYTFQILDRV